MTISGPHIPELAHFFFSKIKKNKAGTHIQSILEVFVTIRYGYMSKIEVSMLPKSTLL